MSFQNKPPVLHQVMVLLCMTFLVPVSSFAQLNSGNLTQFTEEDGLRGVQVSRVLVDRHGYIWLGTINGLVRYNGYEFKRFYSDPNDSTSFDGLDVWSLFEDHHGQIWVGSTSHLNMYDRASQTFKKYDFIPLIPHASDQVLGISAICEDDNGRLYVGVDSRYSDLYSSALLYKDAGNDSLKHFVAPDSLHFQNVFKLEKDKSGNIWCLSHTGIFTIDGKGRMTRLAVPAFEKEILSHPDLPTDFKFDHQGHLWLITNASRLYEFNPASHEFRMLLSDLHPSTQTMDNNKVLTIDKDDNLWISTNGGVQYFDQKTGQFSMFNGDARRDLEHVPVSSLALDSFGTLWMGTFTDGLLKYDDKPQLRSYSFNKADKHSIAQGWVGTIYEAPDGLIWLVTGANTPFAGISILDTKTGLIQSIPYSNISPITYVFSIWENEPGEIYFGCYRRVFTISPKTFKPRPVKLIGAPDTITISYRYKDSRENEWLCTLSSGLYEKERGSQQFRRFDLSIMKDCDANSNNVSRCYESKKHGLWLVTNNGLFSYNYSTGKIDRHGFDKNQGDIFGSQDINSFYETSDGIAWVGTWQGGLSRYDVETKKIKTFSIKDGLPSTSIQSILADEKNNSLWLATFDGLSRFNVKTGQFNNYSIADGVQGRLFQDASYLKTSNGLFLFGGANGVTIFNPDDFNKQSLPPKVFLTGLKLFNKPVMPGNNSILKKPIDETAQIVLAHNQNNLTLDFLAIHYSNPAKNKYSYKLENYDNEWHDIGNQHEAFYPNLPPGDYTFSVKAANDKGVWNEKGATLEIVVKAPWWKTTGAYILYGLLIAAIAYGANRLLHNRLVRKEREKNRLRELEQAREIEKAYHKLEEAHETLKATQKQLIHSEKMASLGELTAGIAHEIQNPLNFVNNFSEVNKELLTDMKGEIDKGNLEEARSIADDVMENQEKINHHGKRADAIVKGMLQHSRTSSGQKELTDINALCDEYLRLAYHGLRAKDKSLPTGQAGFNAKFEANFDSSIGKISIVPQEIGRVILNLISNAFYAVNERQRADGAGYEPKVTVSTKRIGDEVLVSVADNGSGIPQKIVDKIFQPFFTTKPTGQGTGLGLSLAYDIVKAHSGEIKVETKDGEGSEFTIVLPRQ